MWRDPRRPSAGTVIVENMSIDPRASTSKRILEAAAELLQAGGIDAVSTRAVAAAAGTQPPVLYRRFGDKEGLLEAVSLHIVQGYIAQMRKLLRCSDDSVEDLRRLWDLFVAFAAAHPECISLIYGGTKRGDGISAAAETMKSMIGSAIARIADDGKLRMSVERATALFRSCGVGFVVTQISIPESERDGSLSDMARENAISSITVAAPASRSHTKMTGRATALRQAMAADDTPLTPAENALMVEWLNRIADTRQG
jgi:AcrR family transcriptional regulator